MAQLTKNWCSYLEGALKTKGTKMMEILVRTP